MYELGGEKHKFVQNDQSGLKNDKSVVIISAGGLGLLALKIIQAAYNINPIVVDIDDEKLKLAKAAGAAEVINAKDENI